MTDLHTLYSRVLAKFEWWCFRQCRHEHWEYLTEWASSRHQGKVVRVEQCPICGANHTYLAEPHE